MSTISTVAVDFIANVAKYTQGLKTVETQTKRWSDNTKKQTRGAQDAFNGVSSALTNIAKQAASIIAIQRIGSAFVNAARSASQLVDEAEKVGASADTFSRLDTAARKNGTTIDAVKRGYVELTKSVNEAIQGNEETGRSFIQLGISYTQFARLKPDDRFYAIADALKEVKDENERTRLGTILLGRAYTELNPLLLKGAAGIRAAGAGALSGFDLASIDRITKSFEEVSLVLELKVKKALVDLAPSLLKVADGLKFILDNLTGFAGLIGAAFAPTLLIRFGSVVTSLSTIISGSLFPALLNASNSTSKLVRGLTALVGVRLASFLGAASAGFLSLSKAISTVAIQIGKLLKSLTVILLVFEGVTRVVESVTRSAGFDQYAEALKQLRESVEDTVLGLFGFETAADKVKKFEKETGEALEEARKRFDKETAKIAADADRLASDLALLDFRKTLESITKLPLPQKLNELIILFDEFNGKLDPRRQEELTKAISELNDELDRLAQTTLESIDPGERRKRQAEEINALVRAGRLTEEQARAATIKLARDEAAQYDELIAIRQKALEITSNSLLVDKEKEFRLRSLGQSFIDLIDPIGKVSREIQKLNALQVVKAITPEERQALEDYYNLQLRSSQVALAGDDVLSANQRYLETIQQINFLLPQQSQNLEVILLRTQAIQNAEVQRFKEVTPLFKELSDFSQNFADGLSRAIVEGENFSSAFKNVFKSILKDITVLILRTAILRAIMASIGFVNPVAGVAFGQLTGITGPGRADGGPVMGGSPYRVGERGPETFVPEQNGYILPNDMQSGETVIVNQTINVQTGVAQTVRAEMLQLLPRFKSEAMAGVLDAKQRGGSYAKGLSPI